MVRCALLQTQSSRLRECKNATQNKRLVEAQVVRGKYERGEKLTAADLKTIVMCVLPLTKSTDVPTRYSTKDQYVRQIEELPNLWWQCIKNAEEEETVVEEVGGKGNATIYEELAGKKWKSDSLGFP